MRRLILGLFIGIGLLGSSNLAFGQGQSFVRGDCNADAAVNLADVIALLAELFDGTFVAPCVDACDVNDDGARDIGDAIAALDHLFSSGLPPTAPYPDCGADPTGDALSCLSYDPCPVGDPCALPASLSFGSAIVPLAAVPLVVMPSVDVATLQAEDAALVLGSVPACRIGKNLKADLSPSTAGLWETLPDGSQLWRLRVRCVGALWTGVGLGTCHLPDGTRMWIYDEAMTQLDRCISGAAPSHGQRWRYPIPGDTAVVEILSPTTGAPDVHLGTVIHGYEPPLGDNDCPEDCSPDVSCNDFGVADINRGVMRMYMPIDFVDCDTTGVAMCSGSLINNTAFDCKQYVLTAAHCVPNPALVGGASFLFNYERPECCDGVAPETDKVYGAEFRASWPGGFSDPPCFPLDPGGSDFALIEIVEDIPASFDARYNGWSRNLDTSHQVGSIHQPAGAKSKKVAVSFDGYEILNPTRLRIDEWDLGSIKGGSSGAPLFGEDGRIIGVVSTGGPDSDCPSVNVGFARVDASFNGGGAASSRLRDWLDPTNSGALSIPGRDDVVACGLVPWPSDNYALPGGGGIPGSVATLALSTTNAGDTPLTNVEGIITTSTPGVMITTGLANWPDLAGHETGVTLSPHFAYSVAATVPCGSEIVFTVAITSDQGAWFPEVRVRVGDSMTTTAPLSSFFFSDSLVGSNAWTPTVPDDTPEGPRYFVPDLTTASDTALVSGIVFVPDNSRLRFRQMIDCENIYGGGVLELSSVDPTGAPGPWIDARPGFVEGGYNSGMAWTVPDEHRNRAAYSGDSGGWQEVEVDLSPHAGQFLQLRWRFVTDDSGGDVGWWIDDAVIETQTYDCTPD